jgi:hypothetical protein
MAPTFEEELERCLRSPDPFVEFRGQVERCFATGVGQDEILRRFEHFRAQLRRTYREADEDVVMDVMDCLTGWCSPHMKLEPRPHHIPGEA